MNRLAIVSVFFLAVFCSNSVLADWNLESSTSQLSFLSIKKDTVGEVHTFKELLGSISAAGEVKISITLNSVETNIPIRNDRMKEFLFETAKFPLATAVGKLDMTKLDKVAVGEVTDWAMPLEITLHGKIQVKQLSLQVAKLSSGKIWVVTNKPLLLSTDEFELLQGVNKLKELAVLPSISSVVPVTVSLMFSEVPQAKKP
jgi:polyisoprenoid-binding protein YceI